MMAISEAIENYGPIVYMDSESDIFVTVNDAYLNLWYLSRGNKECSEYVSREFATLKANGKGWMELTMVELTKIAKKWVEEIQVKHGKD